MQFPSTFEADFRPMRGAEISALANTPDSSIQEAVIGMLRSTWLKTIEPGPYPHADGDATPQFDKFLSGDLIYALVGFAVDNVPGGELYKFPVQCVRKHRDRQYMWSVNLKTQLLEVAKPKGDGEDKDDDGDTPARVPIRSLSPETIVHLRSTGNRFEESIVGLDGKSKRVVFKLQTNGDGKVIRELQKLYPAVKEWTPTEQIAVQCVEIEGLKSNSIRERYQFMSDVRSADLYALFDRIVAKDCGIETGIQTKCPVCDWEQDVDLPFDRLYSPRRS